jgi:hypothetical protein
MKEARILDIRCHKARTPKCCIACDKKIQIGEAYTKTVGVIDRQLLSNSWHGECFDNHSGYVQDQKRKE